PSAAIDAAGDLGITYMESSNTEYVSMWVGIHGAGDPAGSTTTALARTDNSFMSASSRTGDYSSIVVDPSNPNNFWASNEYSPVNSGTDIWATYIASFHGVLNVVSSNPAAGQVVGTTPNDFTIHWSDAVDPATVNPSDLTVNGIAADSDSVSGDGKTTVFHYTVSPVTTQGPQSMHIAAGAILRLSDGNANEAFDATFYYDTLQLAVASTTPPTGGTAAINAGAVHLIVDFNEA